MDRPAFLSLLPDAAGLQSGGHIYNAALLGALADQGCAVVSGELATVDAAIESRICLFDTLDLGHAATESVVLPRRSLLLVHHLTSFEIEDAGAAAQHFAAHELPGLRRFAGLCVTGPYAREQLDAVPELRPRVLLVEPAVPELAPREAHKGPPRVLMVANLCARKGVLELLEALAGLGQMPAFRLDIVGGDLEAEYAARCRELVTETPVLAERVALVGTLSPAAVAEHYRQADVFVSAASMETYGMAIREAMAAGIPVLLREGGQAGRHLRDGGAGILCADAAELGRELCDLLADPLELASYQAAARNNAPPRRSWTGVARDLLAGIANLGV